MEQKTTIGRSTHRIVVVPPAQVNPHAGRFEFASSNGDNGPPRDLGKPGSRLISRIRDCFVGDARTVDTIRRIGVKIIREENNVGNIRN